MNFGSVPLELWIGLATAVFLAVPAVITFITTLRKVARDADRSLTRQDLEIAYEGVKDVFPAALKVLRALQEKKVPKDKAVGAAVESGLAELKGLRGHDGIGQTPAKARARLERLLIDHIEGADRE